MCGCRNLGEALRRIDEGASMIRTKGEAGTGNVVEAVRHARAVHREIKQLCSMDEDELFMFGANTPLHPTINPCCTAPSPRPGREYGTSHCLPCLVSQRSPFCVLHATPRAAKQLGASFELVKKTKEMGRLPVVNFAAGGVATPADAALMMQLGVDGVFVGSGIFKSGNPAKRAAAIVEAVTHYKDPKVLCTVSENLGEAMVGLNCDQREQDWAGRESGAPVKTDKYQPFRTADGTEMPA